MNPAKPKPCVGLILTLIQAASVSSEREVGFPQSQNEAALDLKPSCKVRSGRDPGPEKSSKLSQKSGLDMDSKLPL